MANKFKILVTSDLHSYLFPINYADNSVYAGSMSRVSSLISKLRDENTLLIDNGDNLEGSPLSFYHYQYHADEPYCVSQAMRDLRYDYLNVGNHDFDHGAKQLFKHLEMTHAKVLTSNVLYKGKPLGPDYEIRTINGNKLAFITVTTSAIPSFESEDKIRDFEFKDAYETVKRIVPIVREKENPDYLIVIYHGGFERNLSTDALLADDGENQGCKITTIPGVDLLISGHQHLSINTILNNVPVIQTNANGMEIGLITIGKEIKTELVQTKIEPDLNFLKPYQAAEDACLVWLQQPLGTAKVDLEIKDQFLARVDKSQAITLINKAVLEATDADLASNALFANSVGFKPQITMQQLIATYTFPNTVVVKEISGKILRKYLEKNAEFFDLDKGKLVIADDYVKQLYNYDMVENIEYIIKVGNPRGKRIISLKYQGKEVKDTDIFTLAVSSYRASGVGGFGMIKQAKTVKEVPTNMIELLATYIISHQIIDFQPTHNIIVRP